MSAFDPKRTCLCPDFSRSLGFLYAVRKDLLPVVLHADNNPPLFLRFVVQRLGKSSHLRIRQALCWTVGEFAVGIVVQHEKSQSRAFAGGCPFQHVTVAAGVSESDAGTL